MSRRRNVLRAAALAIATALAIYAALPVTAFGQGASMSRFGTVEIKDETEYQLFWSLLCRCGCPRETLGTCTCAWAHNMRAELRDQLAKGTSVEGVKASYASKFGTDAVAVPPNEGSQRFVWLIPVTAILLGAGLVGFILRHWVRRATERRDAAPKPSPTSTDDESKYDRRLDDELKALDKE
jgi:cytochrome c-type biogenesis protein CcmH/NrfF